MNVFNKVTLQSLKRNRVRTAVTIIGVILSAAMICAVTSFVSSFRNYALQTAIYEEGNWHGREQLTSFETYEKIKSEDEVQKAVYLQQLGYAPLSEVRNESKPYIYVLGGGEAVWDVLPVHLTAGSYPETAGEILLPEHLYTDGGLHFSIGDTVTLDLGQRMLGGEQLGQNNPCYHYHYGEKIPSGETFEERESRVYTVVGFYERAGWRIEEYNAPGYLAFTAADAGALGNYFYDVYYRMEDTEAIYDFVKKMHLQGEYNTDVLMFSGVSKYDSFTTVLYSLAAIVIALIVFGSVSLIYNAFSISVSERTKQFGLLASVGATKKQLRSMVLFEALSVSVVGIPLGVLAGVGGIGVTLMLIGDKFRSMGFPIDMTLSVTAESVLIAAAVALVTVLISAWIPSKRATKVSAVEAIRQNIDIKNTKPIRTSKLTYKLFGLEGMLAVKHYKRNRRKYRATVLSLFMSIVLFVSAWAFTDYLMQSVNTGFASVDYDILMSVNVDDLEDMSKEDVLERVKAERSVTNAAILRDRYVAAEISSEFLTKEGVSVTSGYYEQGETPAMPVMGVYVTFVDDAAFRALLKEHGLSEKEFMNEGAPLGIAVDGVTRFNPVKEKYETVNYFREDRLEMSARYEKYIEGYYCAGETEKGAIRYVNLDDDNEHIDIPVEDAYVTAAFKTGKVITEKPFFMGDSASVCIIYPMSADGSVFEDMDMEKGYFSYMIQSDDHLETYENLQTFLDDCGAWTAQLDDIAEMEESERNFVTIIRVFSYGFIVLISLIAAANVFNTISTNLGLRRREFAMLKSVGMTSKGFNKMLNFECLLYGSRALLMGLPVSAAVSFLIFKAFTNGFDTSFRLPWPAIAIAVLSVFLVVFTAMMYSMSRIKKDNPIDALKNDNL